MPRTAQLLVSRTAKPDIPAHWSLYIPYVPSSTSSTPPTGKLIHVVGSPLHGYTLEFKASYIPSQDSIKRVPFPLCDIGDEHVNDTECYILNDDEKSKRKIVTGADVEGWEGLDVFEKIAMKVEAPGRLKGWNPLIVPKVGDKNCQWWMRNYIDILVQEGLFGEDVYSSLEKIPEIWDQERLQTIEQ